MSALGRDSARPQQLKDTVFPKVDSLKPAIVSAHLRPRMRGDTTTYNTGNIHLWPNANVEQLLGQLPGLQIDANGNITFNGEKVKNLLVDGEDIFAGNPTMVTRNFDASKIARVEVLNRRSDQALFSGVDDGVRTKTLNLVLKESTKDGYFGKAEAGSNSDGYYYCNAMLAAFKHKEQFTALGLAANTGVLGFSTDAGSAANSASFSYIVPDALGGSAGTGIPQIAGAALHYANSWNEADNHANVNYQYSHFFSRPLTTTQTIQAEPGYTYLQNQQNGSVNRQDQHAGYGTYDWASAKTGTFRFNFIGNSTRGENQFSSAGATRLNDTLVNNSQRTIRDEVIQQYVGGNLNWRTTIKRPSRVLSTEVYWNKTNSASNGYVYSLNNFFQSNGAIQNRDTIDQRVDISNHPATFGGSISYTEPLYTGGVLAMAYSLKTVTDAPLQATYARGDGKYQEIVDSLSSYLHARTISQQGGFNLQGNSRVLSYTIGSGWVAYDYRQKNLLTDSSLHQRYFNWAPRIILTWTPNPATNLQFYYTSMTQQPLSTQLQPVRNNNDPLHITLGNPNLKPAFNKYFYIDIHRMKTWNVNCRFDFSFISNSISTKTTTDSLGRQVSQPVNVNGGRTAGFNLNAIRTILGFVAGIHTNFIYSRTVNYVNSDLSRNDAFTCSGGFNLNRHISDKYLLQLYTNFGYFDQSSSISSATPVHYWTQSHSGVLTIFLLHNLEINTSAIYTWQQKTSIFTTNTSVLLWNGYISHNLLHDRLVLKALWNNILNQNAGISRSNINNVNTESFTNILGRYWMVSITYHFDKKLKQK